MIPSSREIILPHPGVIAQLGEHLPCLIDLQGINAMNTKYLGNLTELQCITRFYELGYPVSIPYGDSEKYDMIIDIANCTAVRYNITFKTKFTS